MNEQTKNIKDLWSKILAEKWLIDIQCSEDQELIDEMTKAVDELKE